MPSHFDQFVATARDMHLDPEEEADIRAALLRHIREGTEPEPKPSLLALLFTPLNMRMAFCTLLVAVGGMGSGIAYAAEYALPGDWLYAFKLAVNENLLFPLTSEASARAENQMHRIDRRTMEEEKLAPDVPMHSLNAAEKQYQVERREAMRTIQELQDSGKPEVAAKLRARMNAYADLHERNFRGRE